MEQKTTTPEEKKLRRFSTAAIRRAALTQIAAGRDYKEVCAELGFTPGWVIVLLEKAYAGGKMKGAALVFALQDGLLDLEKTIAAVENNITVRGKGDVDLEKRVEVLEERLDELHAAIESMVDGRA